MTQRFFLYESSRAYAIANGFEEWWDWLRSRPECVSVASLEEVEAGAAFVSFKPISEISDTFPELSGIARRVLAIADGDNINETCRIAQEAGVEQVFFSRVVEDMPKQPWPSTLYFLLDRGNWLPPLVELREWSTALVSAEVSGRNKPSGRRCVLLAYEEASPFWGEVREGGGLARIGLARIKDELREFFEAQGWSVVEAEIQEATTSFSEASFGFLLADVKSERVLSQCVAVARTNRAILALWNPAPISYFSRIARGWIGIRECRPFNESLRGAIGRLITQLSAASKRDEISVASRSGLTAVEDDALGIVFGNRSPRFARPPYRQILCCEDEFSELRLAIARRLEAGSRAGYLPMSVIAHVFEETRPFYFTLRSNLREQASNGFKTLGELLEQGWKLVGGHGVTVWYYIGWARIISGQGNSVADSFPAKAGYSEHWWALFAAELSLGLLLVDDEQAADALLRRVAESIESENCASLTVFMLRWRLGRDVDGVKWFKDQEPNRHRWTTAVACLGYARSIGDKALAEEATRVARGTDSEAYGLLQEKFGSYF